MDKSLRNTTANGIEVIDNGVVVSRFIEEL